MQKTYHKIVNGDSREMLELKDDSIHLVLTSPPYWQLKDHGTENQIGFHDVIVFFTMDVGYVLILVTSLLVLFIMGVIKSFLFIPK